MRTIRAVAELRSALLPARRSAHSIALVPTMGAFHQGHLSLISRARAECEFVVVSLFVNPTQFDDRTDLAAYPRDEGRDAELAAGLGADYLFAPTADEVYPPGFATTVSVAGLTDRLEGERRGRSHFDGVTTVVTKLLHMVEPDVAYFGQKDAQQVAVIKRLVGDLDFPVRIEVCPTVREPDGLAMSSRNVHLNERDRRRAAALSRALRAVEQAVSAGERDPVRAIARGMAELSAQEIEPEYLELVHAETFTPAPGLDGHVLAVLAACIGGTRLIDNLPIHNPRVIRPDARLIKVDHEVATRSRAPTAEGDDCSVHNPTHTSSKQPRRSASDDAAAIGGEEASPRANRDGDRVRLSVGAGRAGSRRGHRPSRRLRRDDSARVSLDGPRFDR